MCTKWKFFHDELKNLEFLQQKKRIFIVRRMMITYSFILITNMPTLLYSYGYVAILCIFKTKRVALREKQEKTAKYPIRNLFCLLHLCNGK